MTHTLDYAARNPLPLDVISIQSQVVYGTVGNNAALPTLARHGIRATAVPTVLYSNTPHYDTIHGGAIPADWFAGYLKDLERRRALTATRAIILGYLSQRPTDDYDATVAAARSLLGARLKTVIVTSSPGAKDGEIANLIVTAEHVAQSSHPRIDSDVKGTGDAFHAALTAALLNGAALADAVQSAGDWVVAALRYTAAENSGELRFPPQ